MNSVINRFSINIHTIQKILLENGMDVENLTKNCAGIHRLSLQYNESWSDCMTRNELKNKNVVWMLIIYSL